MHFLPLLSLKIKISDKTSQKIFSSNSSSDFIIELNKIIFRWFVSILNFNKIALSKEKLFYINLPFDENFIFDRVENKSNFWLDNWMITDLNSFKFVLIVILTYLKLR